ncbi:MAG: lycopene cyclase domain-containing protein [Haloarculaceae archaeon]
MALSYLSFLLVAVGVPLLALATRSSTPLGERPRETGAGIAVLVAIALVYTTPWDNALIAHGVWQYGDGTVARRLWHAPLAEYLFVLGQSLVVGLWTCRFPAETDRPLSLPWSTRIAGAVAGLLVGAVGLALLPSPPTLYLGAILAWAGPVLALQWGFGWPVLWAHRRRVALAVLVPTAYFSVVDRIAIELGIWSLSDRYTTGLALFGLPVEEALFFLVTSLFLVQGLVLYWWLVDRW